MYFVLKSLKLYLHYSALHISDTIVPIIRSFSAAHAISGPVWCLVRCPPVLLHSKTGEHEPSTTQGPKTSCAAKKLLMMDTMVPETCRAE